MASSKNVHKKRKLLEEKRRLFNDEWLLDYFVTPNTTLKGSGSIMFNLQGIDISEQRIQC